MKYIFEIFDKNKNLYYVDFITKDINIAEDYFNILLKTYDKKNIKIITQFDI